MASETKNRGFASMTAEKQREIARKGGRAAHEKGTAHEFTTDEARAAGKKGGERVSANRSHMAEIGRLGGKSSAGRRAKIRAQRHNPDVGGPSHSTRSHHSQTHAAAASSTDESSGVETSVATSAEDGDAGQQSPSNN